MERIPFVRVICKGDRLPVVPVARKVTSLLQIHGNSQL